MISFLIGWANYCKQNLYNFEYWIMNNTTVRLEHFAKLKLQWKSKKSITYQALCNVSAYEAAGVETHLKRKHMSDEEWHLMKERTCVKMIKEQKKEEHNKCVHHPQPQIPDSILFKKCMKKDEREVQARRKDALSRPPHFWESFCGYAEK